MTLATFSVEDVLLALHILGCVVAFGSAFVIPLIIKQTATSAPAAVSGLYTITAKIGRTVVTPAMVVVLATGLALIAMDDLFTSGYVIASLVILVCIFGIYGAVIIPRSDDVAILAAAREQGRSEAEAEFNRLARLINSHYWITFGLAALAVLIMVLKPF